MIARFTTAFFLGCSLFGTAMSAARQSPNITAAADTAPAHGASRKPTNLKVLPRSMSGDEIDKLMHRDKQDLGVPCGYCHEENTQTKQIDFASDENPTKEIARVMIKMNDDINTQYLAQLGDRRYAEPFTCGNCHQGQVDPPAFEPKQQR